MDASGIARLAMIVTCPWKRLRLSYQNKAHYVQTLNKEQYYNHMGRIKKHQPLKSNASWRKANILYDWKNLKREVDEASARFWAKRHMAQPGSDLNFRNNNNKKD